MQQTKGDGFSELIKAHTDALMKNSNEIAEMLQIIKDKSSQGKSAVSKSVEKDIKFISSELKRLDKEVDGLGG